MKKSITTVILMAILIVAVNYSPAAAQNTSDMHYTDMVGENPTADDDITIVHNYLNTLLVSGDVEKATEMLTPDYKVYGPGGEDSADLQGTKDAWKQNLSLQSDRKVDFVAATFNVKSGDQAGHWVATWGTYRFTQDGKDLRVPFQYTAHISDGKIDKVVVYYDQMYIMKTLGYTITPPEK